MIFNLSDIGFRKITRIIIDKKNSIEITNRCAVLICFGLFISIIVSVSNINGQITDSNSKWFISESKITTSSNLIKISFLNSKQGWTISNKELFKTANGGKTWQKLHPPITSTEQIIRFSFQDVANGILIAQHKLQNLDDKRNFFRVLQTNDGGKTWKERKKVEDGITQTIVFTDQYNGWIVGHKKKGHSAVTMNYLLLRTKDKGRTWEDLSDDIGAQLLTNETSQNRIYQRNLILDATKDSKGEIQLFTSKLDILKSANKGVSWTKKQIKTNIRGNFCCSGNTDKESFWYARSSESPHGIYGEIGIFGEDENVKWNGVANTYFTDVLYLKSGDFLVTGSKYIEQTGKKLGVILYTNNNGVDWSAIHTNVSINSFNSITKLSERNFIAVGNEGEIVKFSLNE